MDNKNQKVIWTIAGVIVLAVLGYWIYARERGPAETKPLFVSNFEECVAAGYPVMESYPRRCSTPEGTTFTEEVGDGSVLGDDDGTIEGDADIDLDNLSK